MKILKTIILIAVMIVVTACAKDKRTPITNTQKSEQTDGQKYDSIKAELTNETRDADSLQTDAQKKGEEVPNKAKGTNEGVFKPHYITSKDGISEESKDNSWMSYLAMTVGALALLLCTYNFYVVRKRESEIWYKIEELEKDVEKKWKKIIQNFSLFAPDKDFKALNDAVENLKARVNGLTQDIKDPRIYRDPTIPRVIPGEVNPMKTGFFGIPRGNDERLIFFNEYSSFQTDRSYFKMEYISEQNCEFYPFDLEKIRSSDSVKKAIEFTGCSMQYAKTMIVSSNGTAYYDKENEYWRLVDKVIIELKN